MAQTQDTTVTGEVEAVNERGVKLNGAWLNFSKFAEVPRPDVGQTVAVTVRGDRWVQGLRVLTPGALDEPEGAAGPDVGEGDPFAGFEAATGFGEAPRRDYPTGNAAPRRVAPAAAPVPATTKTAPAPNRQSVRATTMLAAATWAQGRSDVDFNDLLGVAETLLAWVTDPRED